MHVHTFHSCATKGQQQCAKDAPFPREPNVRTVVSRRYFCEAAVAADVRTQLLSNEGAELVMDNLLLTRTLFNDNRTNGAKGWIRVRDGDSGIDGQPVCTLTYKRVSRSEGLAFGEYVISLEVSSFHECVEFLEEIGLVRVSRQQTRRTSLSIPWERTQFVVTIDEWPWLPSKRMIEFEPSDAVSPQEFDRFLAPLPTDDMKPYSKGVDEVYRTEFEIGITDVPEVRFDIPPPSGMRRRTGPVDQ